MTPSPPPSISTYAHTLVISSDSGSNSIPPNFPRPSNPNSFPSKMGSKWRKAKLALGLNLCYYAPHDFAPLLSPPPPSNLSSSQMICSICLAALSPGEGHAIFTAECSHSFHFHCITSSVSHGNQICPVCRSKWKEIPVHSPILPDLGTVPNLFAMRFNNPRRSRLVSPTFQVTEPDVFNDDECLGNSDNSGETTSNLHAANNNPVKAINIKTFTEFTSVQRNQCLDNFTVLIHLKAAVGDMLRGSGPNQEYVPLISSPSRTPVDLVTVLDISGSMAGTKLALLKRAMGFVIQNLSFNDRLSVVAFSSTARRLFPLLRMSESGRQQALRAVNTLMASGGTNIAEGLRKGAKVMDGRREKNPVASIILLSDGRDNYARYTMDCSGGNEMTLNHQLILPLSFQANNRSGLQIPVHTFGFGTDHDASLLHSISEGSGGMFSFIETEEAIQDAFAECMGGLLSVVVQELQVGVECIHPGTRLVSIKSGSYLSRMMEDGKLGFIDVGDIYAEEERDFLISLNIPPMIFGDSMILLKVSCVFKNPVTKETVTLEGEEVKIERRDIVQEEVVSTEVDKQRNRLRAAEAMGQARTAAEQGDLRSAVSVVENCRRLLASSVSAASQDRLCVALDAELKEMQERMASSHVYETTGRAYVLSGLSSHSWQRAAARGNFSDRSSNPQSYRTSSMMEMLSRSKAASSGSQTDQTPI